MHIGAELTLGVTLGVVLTLMLGVELGLTGGVTLGVLLGVGVGVGETGGSQILFAMEAFSASREAKLATSKYRDGAEAMLLAKYVEVSGVTPIPITIISVLYMELYTEDLTVFAAFVASVWLFGDPSV